LKSDVPFCYVLGVTAESETLNVGGVFFEFGFPFVDGASAGEDAAAATGACRGVVGADVVGETLFELVLEPARGVLDDEASMLAIERAWKLSRFKLNSRRAETGAPIETSEEAGGSRGAVESVVCVPVVLPCATVVRFELDRSSGDDGRAERFGAFDPWRGARGWEAVEVEDSAGEEGIEEVEVEVDVAEKVDAAIATDGALDLPPAWFACLLLLYDMLLIACENAVPTPA
jgi:hypothetical protein